MSVNTAHLYHEMLS